MRPLTLHREDRIAYANRNGRRREDRSLRHALMVPVLDVLGKIWRGEGRALAPSGAKRLPKARRGDRRRRLRRMRRPMIVVVTMSVAALALAGAGTWSWQSGLVGDAVAGVERGLARLLAGAGLTVEHVTVAGRHRTAPAQLLAALDVARGDPIWRFDGDDAKERIEQIGWVRTAAIRRLWPNRIHVEIEERDPYLRWQHDGHTVLIDHEGAVLTDSGLARYRHLRRVVGDGAAGRASYMLQILRLEPDLFARVHDIVFIRERRWDVVLDDGVAIRLPEEDAEAAWHRLARLAREEGLLKKDITVVDLRLPDRLVVRLGTAATRGMVEEKS